MFLYSFLALIATFAASSSAYANPGSCSGSCQVHDPALIQRSSDGTYFRFSTGNKIQIATASSIEGPWTIKGSALPSGSKIDLAGNQDLWAPDVRQIGSTYYLYYAVSTFGSQSSGIGVATSSTMDVGTWTDHGSVGVSSDSSKPYNAIDPSLVTLSNGGYQLNFGSFWSDIYQVQLASTIDKGRNAASQIVYDPSDSHAVEGSYMYYRGGYYYLFWSAGQCCGLDTNKPATGKEYMIKVCRSTSSTGGFVSSSLLYYVLLSKAEADMGTDMNLHSRSTRVVNRALAVEELLFFRATTKSMHQVDST